jgi:hypothetical protein
VLARVVRGVDHATVIARCKADRRGAGHEVTFKAEGRVAYLLPSAVTRPSHVEADVRWDGCRSSPEDGAEEVVKIGNRDVVSAHSRSPASRDDADRPRRDGDRPEQPRSGYARLPVVLLTGRVADGARIVQVNSYETEGPGVYAPVESDVDAAHEPHIGIEVVRGAVLPVGRTADL